MTPRETCHHPHVAAPGELLQPQREVGFRQVLCEAECRRLSGTSVGLCVPFTVLSLSGPQSEQHLAHLAGESKISVLTGVWQVLSPLVWSGGEHTYSWDLLF